MTTIERRQHPRVSPSGLKAVIKQVSPDNTLVLQGEVLDISFDGVKIRLEGPIDIHRDETIQIELFLPESLIPLNLNGVLKHASNTGELGLHYIDCPVVEALDGFLFECNKLADG